MSKYIGTPVVSLSTDTVDVTGDITTTDATPEVIIINDTHEDTDGGREGKVTFKGQASGGEETTLAQIQASHDGTSDDEKGDLIFKTNDGSDGASPTERLRIDSAGNVGIGISDLAAVTDSTGTANLQLGGTFVTHFDIDAKGTSVFANNKFWDGSNNKAFFTGEQSEIQLANGEVKFRTGESVSAGATATIVERMRILNNGHVGINTSTPDANGFGDQHAVLTVASDTGAANVAMLNLVGDGNDTLNSRVASIFFNDASGIGAGQTIAGIEAYRASNHASDGGANLIFNTNENGGNYSEAMRIMANKYQRNNTAVVTTASTTQIEGFYSSGNGVGIFAAGAYSSCGDHIELGCDATASWASIYLHREWGTGEDERMMQFAVNQSTRGTITSTTTGTAYNTSSDYRMKENVTDLTGGITRVKQLEPKRFNFIDDETNTLVDGFMAHEAQTVVPESVKGTKDAVQVWKEPVDTGKKDDEGNTIWYEELPEGVSVGDNKLDGDGNTIPIMQQIDQAKLVPLLTAALQEAIAKIETLETKVAALEGE